MKAALIIEEQIKEIEEVLLTSRAILLGERFDGAMLDVIHALDIVRSLKVKEPYCFLCGGNVFYGESLIPKGKTVVTVYAKE